MCHVFTMHGPTLCYGLVHTYVTEWPNYVKRSLPILANAHWSLTRSAIIGLLCLLMLAAQQSLTSVYSLV